MSTVTNMRHYPEERIILEHTIVEHLRVLPSGAAGEVLVKENDNVQGTAVIARGVQPKGHRIIDVAGPLGIDRRDEEALLKLTTLKIGDAVGEGDPLALPTRRRDRKRVPHSPADGIISLIEDGRIILQVNLEKIEVQARIPGVITEIIAARGARIQTTGAYIQCVWGNGSFNFGSFAFEPEGGLASLEKEDKLLANYRGRVYVLDRPLQLADFQFIAKFRLGGLVAPTMPYHLREVAMAFKVPIILTEGFGNTGMTNRIHKILERFAGQRQVAFDAKTPLQWQNHMPEIIIPASPGKQTITPPAINKPLVVGTTVRLQREPYVGYIAQVVALPTAPHVIENGLRVPTAQVKLLRTGAVIHVPVANLQLMGEDYKG